MQQLTRQRLLTGPDVVQNRLEEGKEEVLFFKIPNACSIIDYELIPFNVHLLHKTYHLFQKTLMTSSSAQGVLVV